MGAGLTMNPEGFSGQPARNNMRDHENGNYHAFNQQDPVYHSAQIGNVPHYDQPVQLSAQRPDIMPTDPLNNYYGCIFCILRAIYLPNVLSVRDIDYEYRRLHSIHSWADDSELLYGNMHFPPNGLHSQITSWQHNGPPVEAPDQLHELFADYRDDYDTSEGDYTENDSYEELLRLEERVENPRGLDRQKIESLVSFEFNADRHQGNQTTCVVCMLEFEPSQLIRMLPCSHEFHAKCIDEWFQIKTTCPLCRTNVSDCTTTSD